MLTPDQERYLARIPAEESVHIAPFNPVVPAVVGELKEKILAAAPAVEIHHIGATALGISGKGDIDLDLLSAEKDFQKNLAVLERLFGPTDYKHDHSVRWFFSYKGFPVEIFLTDPSFPGTREEIAIFEKLRDDPILKRRYEEFKAANNGLSAREYQRRKFEWYNKILGITVDP